MVALGRVTVWREPHRSTLADVKHERMLLLKEGHCFRDDVLTACTRAKVEFHSIFESDQFASIFPLVASDSASAWFPQWPFRMPAIAAFCRTPARLSDASVTRKPAIASKASRAIHSSPG
jgi:DNA-binding transcriptional LysR family regulator